MTAFPRLRGDAALRVSAVMSGAGLVRFLIVPAVIGWLLFVALDAFPGLLPQEIRISKSATEDGAAWAEYDPYLDDFVVFYAAGHLARTGDGSAFDVTDIHEEQARLLDTDSSEVIRLPFFNPPQYLLPLAGLSLLSMGNAAAVWTAGGLAVFVVALAGLLLHRTGSAQLAALATAALVVSMPFHEVILHGQMTFLIFASLAIIYWGAIKADHAWLAGAGLTLLAVKPQLLLVPLLYLVVTKQFGPVWRFALMEAALVAVAVTAYGLEIYGQWLGLVWSALSWEDANGVWIHAMFGWNAFVRALVGPDHQLMRSIASMMLGAATITFVVMTWLLGQSLSNSRILATIVFAGLLLSPHLFAQDLLLVGVALLALLSEEDDRTRTMWSIYGAVGWALTFWHFGRILPDPNEHGLNLVTLWLAVGLVMAGTPRLGGFRWSRSDRTSLAVRAAEEMA